MLAGFPRQSPRLMGMIRYNSFPSSPLSTLQAMLNPTAIGMV